MGVSLASQSPSVEVGTARQERIMMSFLLTNDVIVHSW